VGYVDDTAGPGWRGSSHSATSDRLDSSHPDPCSLAFSGTFEHSLDAKNRLTVPSRFRAQLSGPVFLVRGTDPCIRVYPGAHYEHQVAQALAGRNPMSPQYMHLSRYFNSRMTATELDGAGRLTLTAGQMEHAQITGRETMIVGAGDALEVWDRAVWTRHEAELDAEIPDLLAALDHSA
jgi:MraZ protein